MPTEIGLRRIIISKSVTSVYQCCAGERIHGAGDGLGVCGDGGEEEIHYSYLAYLISY